MEKAFCTECGAQVAADDAFCEHCGARLLGAGPAAPAEPAPFEPATYEPAPPPPVPPPPAPAPYEPAPADSPKKAPSILWGLLTIVLSTILLIAVLLGLRRVRALFGGEEAPPALALGTTVESEPVAPAQPLPSGPTGDPRIHVIPPGDQEVEPAPTPTPRPLPPPPLGPGAGFQSFSDMSEEEFMNYSRSLWERSQKEGK